MNEPQTTETKLADIAMANASPDTGVEHEVVYDLDDVSVSYGGVTAVGGVTFRVREKEVTALIGPSGCGKTTILRSLNRMNDLIPSAKVHGRLLYHGDDVNSASVDPVELRRRIGMVFQKPNPFPKSIYDNIAFALRIHGMKDDLDGRVERALRQAALWDEVKSRLKKTALGLSGGQQQRLCIARALAVEPEVLLMDEPASALDPIATAKLEDLISELHKIVTIVIVTHNMQQAARVSQRTAFFYMGKLVEIDETQTMFTRPSQRETEDYITGKFG